MIHTASRAILMLTLLLAAGCTRTISTPVIIPTSSPTSLPVPTHTMEPAPTDMSQMAMSGDGAASETPYSTATSFPTFTAKPTLVEQAPVFTSTPSCTNLIEFVKNLTIGDNAVLEMGTNFAKLWQVKNAGTCTWSTGYSIVFVTGDQFDGPEASPLMVEAVPGQIVDLRLSLIAPHDPGTYTGSWMLQDEEGNRFGLVPDGSQPLSLTIVVETESGSGHASHH